MELATILRGGLQREFVAIHHPRSVNKGFLYAGRPIEFLRGPLNSELVKFEGEIMPQPNRHPHRREWNQDPDADIRDNGLIGEWTKTPRQSGGSQQGMMQHETAQQAPPHHEPFQQETFQHEKFQRGTSQRDMPERQTTTGQRRPALSPAFPKGDPDLPSPETDAYEQPGENAAVNEDESAPPERPVNKPI